MNLNRLKAPALAATAILLISGAGIAFAGNPTHPAISSVEARSPDTDQLQQGDQTTPDGAVSATKAKITTTTTTDVRDAAKTDARDVSPSDAEDMDRTADSDGPGGHADPAGTAVDHQFQGQE